MNVDSAFPSKFLKASDLNGRRVVVIIREYRMESVGQDDTENDKPVLYFKGKNKGLVLNRTNATSIAEILGQSEMEEWTGGKVVLYPTKTDFQGRRVACIRVDGLEDVQPVQAPVPRDPGEDDEACPF